MKNKSMYLLLLVLMIPVVFSIQVSYKVPYAKERTDLSSSIGDAVYTTYYTNTSLSGTTNSSFRGQASGGDYYTAPLIANFVNGNDQQEIIEWGSCGITVSNLFTEQISNYSLCGGGFNTISGAIAHDWDNDLDYELIVTYSNATKGIFEVFNISTNGTFSSIFSDTTSALMTYRLPVSYGNYIYAQDINNNLYRWQEDTGTKTTLNYGSLSSNINQSFLTIDDCNPSESGVEIMTYGDLDNDGEFDDIVQIDLESMSVLYTKNDAIGDKYWIKQPITCQEVGNNQRIFVVGIYGVISGNPCYCTDTFTAQVLNSTLSSVGNVSTSTSKWVYNFCTGFVENNCKNGFYANQLTTVVSVSPTQSPNYFCIGQDKYSGNDEFACYDENMTKIINTTANFGDRNQITYYSRTKLSTFDMDNDGINDIITGGGTVIKQTGGILSTLLTLPSSSTNIHWASFQDDESYADYVGIRYDGLLNFYWDYLGDINESYNETINVTENVTIVVKFNETFNSSSWTDQLSLSDCEESSYFSVTSGTPVYLDNSWYCYVENKTGVDYFTVSQGGTTNCNTPECADVGFNTSSGQYPNIASFSHEVSTDFDMEAVDVLTFTCDLSDTDTNSHIYFAVHDVLQNYFPVISLRNGSCAYADELNLSFGTEPDCCEMIDIMGFDCGSGKATFNKSISGISNACTYVGEADFLDIKRIETIEIHNQSVSNTEYYIDDLLFYTPANYTNNTLPVILYVTPIPDPQEVNTPVIWSVGVSDGDSPLSEIYTGFDCNDDGNLEHPLAIQFPNATQFSCSYSSIGTYTGRAFASDVDNYPNTTNLSNTVDIIDSGIPAYVNCSGFTAPTCIGDCYFYDDFDYNYSILCHDWLGTNRTPVNNVLWLYDLDFGSQLYLNKITDPISDNDYATFSVEFNFMDNSDTTSYFQIYDSNIYYMVLNLQFTGTSLYVTDDVSPTYEYIGSYNQGQTYHLKATINYNANTIIWDFSGNNATVETEISNNQVEDAGYFSFDWVTASLLNLTLDNFSINYGIIQTENVTEEEEEIGMNMSNPTYLTTGNFCGINWTQKRFIEQDCIDRNYNYPSGLEQVCMIRACVSDTFTWLYYRALQNIFKTLIIVVAILLIAPLFIALLGKIRR